MLNRLVVLCLLASISGILSCGEYEPADNTNSQATNNKSLSSTATALEGIYEIDGFTQNEEGCDSDGDSVLTDTTQTLFF